MQHKHKQFAQTWNIVSIACGVHEDKGAALLDCPNPFGTGNPLHADENQECHPDLNTLQQQVNKTQKVIPTHKGAGTIGQMIGLQKREQN